MQSAVLELQFRRFSTRWGKSVDPHRGWKFAGAFWLQQSSETLAESVIVLLCYYENHNFDYNFQFM